MPMNALIAVVLALSIGMPSFSALARYPTKPIKLIVGFPPGGPVDAVARVIARNLSEQLGQQMIVESRPGAGGTIGATAAARSAADGYTLFLGTTGTLASAPSLYPDLQYHPVESFTPISRLVEAPFLVMTNAAVPARTLRELVDLARSRPGQLSFGSGGIGGPPHIAGEMFKTIAGVDLLHVPYKGTASALTDLVPGRIDLLFDVPAAALPYIQSGQIRALAVAGPRRLPRLPSVPTTAEAGLPGYEISVWFALLAPRGTPLDIVQLLNTEVRKALAKNHVAEVLSGQGFEPSGSSPEELSALVVSDIAKWALAVKSSGAKLQ